MLAEPERTPYDLRFRLFGFPIRVHPWFWILIVLFNLDLLLHKPEYLILWAAVVFVSILIHELGHALAFRRFGADAHIVLHWLGGLAIPGHVVSGRWRRIVVSLAGPFAGFVLFGVLYGTNAAFDWGRTSGPYVAYTYGELLFVNLYWGLLNLLPVFPLDGGQVSRELCIAKWGHRGTRVSLKVSIATALVIVVYSLFCALDTGQFGTGLTRDLPWWVPRGTVYLAILFGFLAYSSYQLLQRIEWTDTHWDDRLPWEK